MYYILKTLGKTKNQRINLIIWTTNQKCLSVCNISRIKRKNVLGLNHLEEFNPYVDYIHRGVDDIGLFITVVPKVL